MPVELEQDQEEREVGENPPVDAEWILTRPLKKTLILGGVGKAAEPEEEDEPEPMDFEQGIDMEKD